MVLKNIYLLMESGLPILPALRKYGLSIPKPTRVILFWMVKNRRKVYLQILLLVIHGVSVMIWNGGLTAGN
jgi:hypothetical protein